MPPPPPKKNGSIICGVFDLHWPSWGGGGWGQTGDERS